MEIPVLGLTFGMAALINKGTNYMFGTISFISNSVAIVLQLADVYKRQIYESCIKFARGIPVPMPLTADNDFRPDVEKLKSLITPKTKLIIINNPGNPTGGIFEKEDILAIADILKDRPDIFVLSDEIYDRLMYDGETISIASIPEMRDRTLVPVSYTHLSCYFPGYCVCYS